MKSCSFKVRHTIHLFAMKHVDCTTVWGKLELELALNLHSCTGLDKDDVEAGRIVLSREVHRCHFCKEFKLKLD